MNVDDETVWACPYVDFPVVRIRTGRIEAWPTDVTGASALLVDGHTVVLVGGYGPYSNQRVVIGTLQDGRCTRIGTRRLEMADGNLVPENARTIGCHGRLFVLTDTGHSTISVADIQT